MLAQYWRRHGHDVRVIAIDDPAVPGKLDNPLEPDCVHYLGYESPGKSIDEIGRKLRSLRAVLTRRRSVLREAANDGSQRSGSAEFDRKDRLAVLRQLYWQLMHFPDRYRHWIDPAVRRGVELGRTWMPDIVYSTCPPHSGHIVAQRVASRLGVPWIAELRDLWVNNPYNDIHPIIYPAQKVLAHYTLRRASACVTLTRSAAREIEASVGRPTIVSYNGFDRSDFADLDAVAPIDPHRLTIVHAGIIYAGRRDPTSLFQALAILGRRRCDVRVLFYHDDLASVTRAATQLGVVDCIEICPAVPRKEILRIERAADVLLLSRWADPADDGIIPGKLFEYIGARRPVLAVGSTTGEAVDIIRSGGFGFVSNDPMEIARQLRAWIELKRKHDGRLPDLDRAATLQYMRDEQFNKIGDLLDSVGSVSQARADSTRTAN